MEVWICQLDPANLRGDSAVAITLEQTDLADRMIGQYPDSPLR